MTHDEPDEMVQHLTALLERSGRSPVDARTEALRAVQKLSEAQAGTSRGGAWIEDVPALWRRAQQSGARRVVLEITSEASTRDDDFGKLRLSVLERDDWDASDEPGTHRAYPLTESDHLALGEDATDVWTPPAELN